MNYKKLSFLSIATIIIIAIIYYIDIPLAKFIKNNINKSIIHIFEKITVFGSFIYIAIINILVFLYLILKQRLSKNKKAREYYSDKTKIMFYGILAQSFTAITIQILKFLFGRMRPFFYLSQNISNTFTFFNFNSNFVSFPSGHSAGIWALTTCLFILLKENKYKILLIVPAILISLSRVILNVHFLSDIIVGGLLGIILSIILMRKLIILINNL